MPKESSKESLKEVAPDRAISPPAGYVVRDGIIGQQRAAFTRGAGVSATIMTQIALPPAVTSPSAARRFVRDALISFNRDADVETAQLLVSELVTNAVMHAASPVQVTLEMGERELLVEVADTSDAPVVPRDLGATALTALSGRGLLLVDRLAKEWGTQKRTPGKSVWFVLPLSDRAATSRRETTGVVSRYTPSKGGSVSKGGSA